jgi:hypothetical protein
VLAEQEHQQRHQARQRRLLHEAQLPVPKTLADYDWNAIPDLERPQIEQLAHDAGWLDRAENLLLFGPSGVGSALPSDRGVRRLVRSTTGSGRGIGDHEASEWFSCRCRLPLPSQGERGGAPAYVIDATRLSS